MRVVFEVHMLFLYPLHPNKLKVHVLDLHEVADMGCFGGVGCGGHWGQARHRNGKEKHDRKHTADHKPRGCACGGIYPPSPSTHAHPV